jgi:hypothetical protein
MGANLFTYGNHKINFKNRNYEEIGFEIKNKLNNYKIINEEYIKALMIYWEKSILDYPEVLKDKVLDTIFEIKDKKNWEWNFGIIDKDYWENEYGMENIEYNAINIIGFLGFEFVFSNDKIYFKDQPPYRYWGWFNMEKIVRDEWRKYLFQILNLFGGNRVIYLPDNMSDAEKYQDDFDLIDSPFEEIEKDLIKEYGQNNYSLDNMTENDGNEYYIDKFENLEIKNSFSINDFVNYLERDNLNEYKHFYFA